jgi:hypothetical protein
MDEDVSTGLADVGEGAAFGPLLSVGLSDGGNNVVVVVLRALQQRPSYSATKD